VVKGVNAMNWLNIETKTIRSEEYLGSEPIQRATWLNLMAYCADQENGGVIKHCLEWNDRKWMQLLGVTSDEVLDCCELWCFTGSNLRLWGYPKAKEAEVKAKREAGKKGGRPLKTKAKKPDGYPISKPSGLTELKGSNNGKERKEKGKEGNNKKKLSIESIISELEEPRKQMISDWIEYKVEIKSGYKPVGLKALIKKLSKYSDDIIEKSIEDSMANGWRGLFPERIEPTQSKEAPKSFEEQAKIRRQEESDARAMRDLA
jgi:hypothetical protein